MRFHYLVFLVRQSPRLVENTRVDAAIAHDVDRESPIVYRVVRLVVQLAIDRGTREVDRLAQR